MVRRNGMRTEMCQKSAAHVESSQYSKAPGIAMVVLSPRLPNAAIETLGGTILVTGSSIHFLNHTLRVLVLYSPSIQDFDFTNRLRYRRLGVGLQEKVRQTPRVACMDRSRICTPRDITFIREESPFVVSTRGRKITKTALELVQNSVRERMMSQDGRLADPFATLTSSYVNSTVSAQLVGHACRLAWGKLRHAAVQGHLSAAGTLIQHVRYTPVVRVVHVVVDGVQTGARTRIAASRASTGRRGFRRSIIHHVANSIAATHEGVVEAHPVPRLVC